MRDFFTFSPTELTLAGVTAGLFFIQLLYYLVTYARPLRIAKRKNTEEKKVHPPVSIIVYAKNESENLHKHLPSLLTQEYPEYEVIVINDGSTDESDEVLNTLENEYKHLYHTYIPEDVKYLSRKKLALTVGIKAAKHDILLFTEANCEPLHSQWIGAMVHGYTEDTKIILGFSAYGSYKGFLHKQIAYDNLMTGLQTLSSALKGNPFTASGRNLSYRKELFFAQKGYSKSLSLHAGDDDLFVNASGTSKNTRVEYAPESIIEMAKIECFSTWKEMKVSRAATQRYYKGQTLTFYRMESLSYFLFFACVVISVVTGILGNWFIAVLAGLLFLIRFGIKATILHQSALMLQQKPITGWLFFVELFQPIFNIYVRIYRIFRGKKDYTFRLGK